MKKQLYSFLQSESMNKFFLKAKDNR